MIMQRRTLGLATIAFVGHARAETWPSRTIRMVVPWAPGQATDLGGRFVAQKLSESLGHTVVVENRPGAGGMIGTDAAAKAAPDGYTLLAASGGAVTLNPLVQKTPYDPERDLAPVAMIGLSPMVLVTRADFPANSLQEFLAVVRANPGRFNYSSSGAGATAHLSSEWLHNAAGLKVVHVPFAGSAASLTAVVAGQIDYTMDSVVATMPHVRAGRVKALGFSLSRPSALAPGIPTIAEAGGIPGYDAAAWLGLMVPAATPEPIIRRLAAECGTLMAGAEAQERFAAMGIEVDSRPTAPFAAYLREQRAVYARVVQQANIRIE
jgi:tripartite-type tricarboxylate transporter receptor subunit TctC